MTQRDKLREELKELRAQELDESEIVEQLREPEVPVAGRFLWDWFWDLSETRDVGVAPSRLKYREILAWAILMRVPILPNDVVVLMAMDAASLHASYEFKQSADLRPATTHNVLSTFMNLASEKVRKGYESVIGKSKVNDGG